MRKFICIILLACSCSWLYAQLQNPSFEDNGQPSLAGWLNYYCDFATSENDAPPGGGQWCVKMQPGQTQGCYPGYFYQPLPEVTNGQSFQLDGWARVDENGPVVGIYFGRKDMEGTIHLLAGDTTSSESWTMLSVQDTFELQAGDTAIVVINSGLVGGPVGPSHSSYFDELHLGIITSTDETHYDVLKVFPNPVVHSRLYIEADPTRFPIDEVLVFNVAGRLIFKSTHHVNSISVDCWNTGMYFLKIKSGGKELVKKIIIN